MNKLIFIIILQSFMHECFSQRNVFYPGAGAYSKTFRDVFSWELNPAVLAEANGFNAGIYSRQYFQLQGLSDYSFSTNIKEGNNGIAVGGSFFGNESYSEWSISAGFGKTLGRASAGINFQYESFTIAGYGGAGKITAGFGSVLRLSDHIDAGIFISIPKQLNAETRDNKTGIYYSFGIGIEPSPSVAVCLTLNKQRFDVFNAEVMLMYKFKQAFLVSAGIKSSNSSVVAGAGWRFNQFLVLVNCSFQPYLGIVPGFMIEYTHIKRDG